MHELWNTTKSIKQVLEIIISLLCNPLFTIALKIQFFNEALCLDNHRAQAQTFNKFDLGAMRTNLLTGSSLFHEND